MDGRWMVHGQSMVGPWMVMIDPWMDYGLSMAHATDHVRAMGHEGPWR